MENGVGIVNGSHLVDKMAVEDRVLESRVDESPSAVLDESKDSEGEGDDVFEEAVEVDTSRVDCEGIAASEFGNVEKVEDLDASLEVGGGSIVGNEVETFEEAIGIPSRDENCEEEPRVVIEEKVEDLLDGDPVSKAAIIELIDDPHEQTAKEKVVIDELNGLGNHGLAVNEEHGATEVPAIAAIGDMRISKDGDEEDKNSGVVIPESEKGNLSDVIDSEITDHGDVTHDKFGAVLEVSAKGIRDEVNSDRTLVHDHSENGDANVEKIQADEDLLNRDVIEPVVGLHEKGISKEVRDTPSNSATENRDDMSKELEDGSAGFYSEHHNDMVEKPDEHFDKVDAELKDNLSVKLKEESSFGLGPEHLDDIDQDKDTSGILDIRKEDDIELKEASIAIMEGHHGESCEPKDNLKTSVEKGNESLEVGSSPISEDSAAEKIPPAELHLEAKSKAHQPEGASDENNVNNSEMEGAKCKEVNGSTQRHSEREFKTAANAPSLTGKSANPAPTPTRPAGLGRAAPLLEPASRAVQQPRVNGTVSQMQNQLTEDSTNGEAEENDETREKLQMIRVKFLRLAHRLGQTPHNVVVAQVLYRLGLAEQLRGRNSGRVGAFSFDRASAMAEQLEAAGQEPLDFSCTIMVLGKSGVGKSATINSIFDEVKFNTDAFRLGTKRVQDVVGTVQGIKVRVIDTPGLLPSWSDQRRNEKILHSVKAFIKKTPPDIVLYLDRLDMQSRDLGDMPLLRTITDIFGPSIWFNAIVVLTHAASAPPDGPNGVATSYDMFVTQRSHVVQQAIRQAAGDMRLMNPVSLVENHSACRTNRAGQRVLPNGQIWKPHLLLLSFASKILAEANTLLKLQDGPPGNPFPARPRAPPLPFLLSSLLQSRSELKLPEEQFGDDDDPLDGDLDVSSDSDEESEYDELPPFNRLTKVQLTKLSKAQKKAYYDELEYREKLFMKKQLKEEKRRRRMMKKMAALTKDLPNDYNENAEEESGGAASVPVSMPELSLPPSFDSEIPTHRYRSLDSKWLVRPVLESHVWDHDVGYDGGINAERSFVVKDTIPISVSGQVTKDKKDSTIQLEVVSSLKHGEGKATTVGFDMQNMGKDVAYTLRSETRFCNYRQNKAMAGLSVTVLGDTLAAGVKVEDKLIVNKRFKLVMSGGAVSGHGDVAYGGSLEATLRDKDYPLGRFLATCGLSVMDWHGDLAVGWNCQAQLPIGRFTNLIGRFNLNNRGSGQVTVRLNSSEQFQLALIGLIPLLRKLMGSPQELQFGHT